MPTTYYEEATAETIYSILNIDGSFDDFKENHGHVIAALESINMVLSGEEVHWAWLTPMSKEDGVQEDTTHRIHVLSSHHYVWADFGNKSDGMNVATVIPLRFTELTTAVGWIEERSRLEVKSYAVIGHVANGDKVKFVLDFELAGKDQAEADEMHGNYRKLIGFLRSKVIVA